MNNKTKGKGGKWGRTWWWHTKFKVSLTEKGYKLRACVLNLVHGHAFFGPCSILQKFKVFNRQILIYSFSWETGRSGNFGPTFPNSNKGQSKTACMGPALSPPMTVFLTLSLCQQPLITPLTRLFFLVYKNIFFLPKGLLFTHLRC